MTPKKDEYMRGYGDGFKDARKQMQPPAGETIRSTQDGSMEAAPVTGQSPVGAVSTMSDAELIERLRSPVLGTPTALAAADAIETWKRRAERMADLHMDMCISKATQP